MKFISLIFILNVAIAGEVKTDCPAMNENREKIVKTVSKVKTNNVGAVKQ